MKVKELQSLRTKQISELTKIVSEKKNEAGIAYAKIKAGQEKNVSRVKNLRHDIAQILTLIREKQILEKEQGSKPEVTKK